MEGVSFMMILVLYAMSDKIICSNSYRFLLWIIPETFPPFQFGKNEQKYSLPFYSLLLMRSNNILRLVNILDILVKKKLILIQKPRRILKLKHFSVILNGLTSPYI